MPFDTYAATTITYARRAIFNRTANADLLLQTLFHYRDQGRYQLHAFVIMPEHIHLLITPSADQTIERCMQCIKGGFPMPCVPISQARYGNHPSTPTASAMPKIACAKACT